MRASDVADLHSHITARLELCACILLFLVLVAIVYKKEYQVFPAKLFKWILSVIITTAAAACDQFNTIVQREASERLEQEHFVLAADDRTCCVLFSLLLFSLLVVRILDCFSAFYKVLQWWPGSNTHTWLGYPSTTAGCYLVTLLDTYSQVGILYLNTVIVILIYFMICERSTETNNKRTEGFATVGFLVIPLALAFAVLGGTVNARIGWCIASSFGVLCKQMLWYGLMICQLALIIPINIVVWKTTVNTKRLQSSKRHQQSMAAGTILRFFGIIITQLIGLFPLLLCEFLALVRVPIPQGLIYLVVVGVPISRMISGLVVAQRLLNSKKPLHHRRRELEREELEKERQERLSAGVSEGAVELPHGSMGRSGSIGLGSGRAPRQCSPVSHGPPVVVANGAGGGGGHSRNISTGSIAALQKRATTSGNSPASSNRTSTATAPAIVAAVDGGLILNTSMNVDTHTPNDSLTPIHVQQLAPEPSLEHQQPRSPTTFEEPSSNQEYFLRSSSTVSPLLDESKFLIPSKPVLIHMSSGDGPTIELSPSPASISI